MTTPDFETIYDAHESLMLTDAYQAITTCNLWEWMRVFHPKEGEGFMFATHPNLNTINDAMKYQGHSGASYGWTMRQMESIAKRGWDEHKSLVLRKRAERELEEWAATQRRKPAGNPCPCRAAKGFTSGWCGVAGGGVPACDH
jgi:hypothetical protein